MMGKHYDIAIYGLWYGNNYGSIITYYALSKVIEKMGYTYAMIRNPLGREINIEALERSHPLKFAKNHYQITPLLPINRLNELNSMFDTFILGSDQMWNYNLSKPYQQSYFFDFVNDDKCKIAYATSFGRDKYIGPDDEKMKTYHNLHRFNAISVRDDFSADILKQIFDINAEMLLDPVFLCERRHYQKLINEESEINLPEEYIFSYILDPNEVIGKELDKIAIATEKKIYVVFNQSGDKDALKNRLGTTSELIQYIYQPTVSEWLALFQSADYVLTDSFHGMCFSIIFEKEFIVLKNNGRGGSRFTYLLNQYDLIDRMIDNASDFYQKYLEKENKKIKYSKVRQKLNIQKKQSYKWLKKSINLKKRLKKLIEPNIEIKKSINLESELKQPAQSNGMDSHKTVLKIVEDRNCSGCGACASICPKNAIEMVKNEEGFLEPKINRNKCIDCNACVKKCTSANPVYKNDTRPECYAMMANDEVRKVSSSGGMFTVAAEYVLRNKGYVVGAAYKDDFSVEHIIIDSMNEIYKLRGSKYMQSNVQPVHKKVKELLVDNKLVLFTGMPCQIAGLYSYLGKDYENLYTIDLLCHGITSSKVFEKYNREVLDGKRLNRLEFKEKEPWGWHAGVNAYFTDGTKYSEPLERDPYFIAYLKSISKNTTCGKCKSNTLPRQGDLTIGDFWGIPKSDPDMYDKKGTSVVLINNQKAKTFFEKLMPDMYKVKIEKLQDAISGNHIIEKPYKLNKNRDLFFKNIDKLKFVPLTMGCYHNELYKYEKEKLLEIVPEQLHTYFYLAKAVAENRNGRKVVTWIKNKDFEEILMNIFGISVEFSIAKSKNRINNVNVFPVDIIKNCSKDYYIVALDTTDVTSTYNLLESYGYRELTDFICRIPRQIVVDNFDLSLGRYEDLYGNTIEGYSGKLGKVVFRGCNNHIIIGDKVIGTENLSYELTTNSYIEIKNESRINSKNRFVILGYDGNSKIIIEGGCRLTDALFRVYNSKYTSYIHIKENCTFETNIEFHANSGKKINIGKDCMFSHDIDLWAGDGHSIFDVTTGENINSVYDKQPSYRNEIVIGEHVWVGKSAFIMHGTNIGNGSIIGAKSVVKGKYPNNCTISGNPARLVRKNCAWSREMATENPLSCGVDYYALTQSLEKQTNAVRIDPKKISNWLVTGGSTGLGRELVLFLHRMGYTVAATSRDISKLSDLPEEIIKIQLDVRDMSACKSAISEVIEKIGRIDVLVNNAGLSHTSTFEETPNEIGENIICTNFWGVANMIKAIIPHMRENRNGTVINISSASGFRPRNYGSYYVASKFAVESLTKNIKFECQKFMRVMAVELGGINTGLSKRQTVIHTKFDEYRNLPEICPYKGGYVNKVNKVVETIVDVVNDKELPRDLILGWDAYQQFPATLSIFESEVETNKSISITTDLSKKDIINLQDVTGIRNDKMKIQNWLITGASGGFGKVLALRLRDLGYSVAVTSRNIDKLEGLPNDIYKIESKLDSEDECKRVIEKAVKIMGSVDVLVNNATSHCWCNFEEIPEEIMRDVFHTNYIIPQNMIKSVLPYMREKKNGTVINLTSIAAIQPRARASTYSAAKAAMEGLTRVLKSECQRFARFMAVEMVCMQTGIMKHNPVFDTKIDDYKNLGRYTKEINNIPNRKDIAAQQIINIVNQEILPQSLLIGTESYLIVKNEIERSREEYEKYKERTLSVCDKSQ